jgi:hypothetical protein
MTRLRSGGKRTWRARAIAFALGIVAAAVLGEGLLRFLLFGDSTLARALGRDLRVEGFYSDRQDSDWWKLQWIFHHEHLGETPSPDPLLGWTGQVTPGTYVAPGEADLAGRTPVLLFGDSNAQCQTQPEECFQGLMERSELSEKYALLNFGVGGYGLDQIQRLMSASIDRFAGREPIVIVSFMVDDDLERSGLDFRGWPKPRYSVAGGELVEPGPLELDPRRFVEAHPPRIRSYLWRLVRRAWRPFDWNGAAEGAELEERRALNRAILERIRAELESRKLRWFLLVFEMDGFFEDKPTARWSLEVVNRFVADHDVPCIRLGEYFAAARGPLREGMGDLIGRKDPILMNHLNDGGNKVVFEAIRQGLAAVAEGEWRTWKPDLERVRRMAAEGAFEPDRALVRELQVLGRSARFEGRTRLVGIRWREAVPGGTPTRLSMRAGEDGWARLEVDLGGESARLTARVRAVGVGGRRCAAGSMKLSTRTDGGEWSVEDFAIGAGERAWSADTHGARVLEMKLEYSGGDPDCAWLLMDELTSS